MKRIWSVSMLAARLRREAPLFVTLFLLVGAALVWIRTATVRETYRFVGLRNERKRVEEELAAQKVRWLRMTAPRRLEAMAGTMGLKAPTHGQVLRYESSMAMAEDGTAIDAPAPARSAQAPADERAEPVVSPRG
jgi:hypothetical protein